MSTSIDPVLSYVTMPNCPTHHRKKEPISEQKDGESDDKNNNTDESVLDNSPSSNASLVLVVADGTGEERDSLSKNHNGFRREYAAGTAEEEPQSRLRNSTRNPGEERPRFPKVTDKQELLSIRNRVFVGGLNEQINEKDLRQLFGGYGEVVEVLIKQLGQHNSVRGHAFVTFRNSRQADAALKAGAGERLSSHGVHLVVNEAVRRIEKPNYKSKAQGSSPIPIPFPQTPQCGWVPFWAGLNWNYAWLPLSTVGSPIWPYTPDYAPMPGVPRSGPHSRNLDGQNGCQCPGCFQLSVTRPESLNWNGMNGSRFGSNEFLGASTADNRSGARTPTTNSRGSSNFGSLASTPQRANRGASETRYSPAYGHRGDPNPPIGANLDHTPRATDNLVSRSNLLAGGMPPDIGYSFRHSH